MIIHSADFLISNTDITKCPEPNKPEYAFVGRSNVGKSSLINMLTNYNRLAKVSATPGKTQTINHFSINDDWYLVDLPGYGYAKISKTQREKWAKFIHTYLKKRKNLMCVCLLIDSRHSPQKVDTDFMAWMANNRIPFIIIFTKIDKLSSNQLKKNIKHYTNELLKTWESLPQFFLTSSSAKQGREEVLNFIEKTNDIFEEV